MNFFRFLGILACALALVTMQAKFYPGHTFLLNDAVLVFLVASSLFLDFLPMLFICLCVVFLTTWQSGISFEMIFEIAVPAASSGLRHLLRLRPVMGSAVFTVSSVLVLYGVSSWKAAIADPSFFIQMLVVDVFLAMAFAFLLEFLYGASGNERLR